MYMYMYIVHARAHAVFELITLIYTNWIGHPCCDWIASLEATGSYSAAMLGYSKHSRGSSGQAIRAHTRDVSRPSAAVVSKNALNSVFY